jgi:hypothetical protein
MLWDLISILFEKTGEPSWLESPYESIEIKKITRKTGCRLTTKKFCRPVQPTQR